MCSWSVIHSGSVQFSSRYLPCCRPVSGGAVWLFIRRHQPGYRCVQWHPSVGVVHTSSLEPSGCLSYGALHVQPHHLSSSSPRPVRHRTALPYSGLR
ncbi:hypothetical protein HMPREF9346_04931 [Escherichia coli MS 119-7]|uniref:Uncharacterized protein n=1 Tax=Escherichia coli MS 85-1 TaxID=679202 RepID=A0AAN3M5S8_ECOLX|nr:hypothetical protein HMPREF9346_04931 [Escherichia coli MS 119-7]EFU33199.1 hypothetical protein HMPREF9350_04994 [Escherichia coli MS 85-1]ESD98965.1 hypothetical protein HMPREF1616_04705 [Escherichia coli 908658]